MSTPHSEVCAQTPTPEDSTESARNIPLSMDQPCENMNLGIGGADSGSGDLGSDSQSKAGSPRASDSSRNPITGLGLNGDGVGGWKPKKNKEREGNPVTGEGYSGPVAVPGVHPVVNKNRVPPGGYSSGLW